jgi:hypothetical protein
MENSDQQNVEQSNLIVTEEMRGYIYDIAKWSNFLAVVGFVFSGITIIVALTIGSAIDSNKELVARIGDFGPFAKVFLTVINFVLAFSLFYPSLLLFKYSGRAKYGVLYGEQASLDEAFSKLKSLFKYWGIITMIFIGAYLLMFFSSILAELSVSS